MLLSIAGPTDLTLHEVNQAADAITRVAHPDANIIFGAVVDDALGEEVRVTVVAAGFDKVAPSAAGGNQFESTAVAPARGAGARARAEEARESLPSILAEDADDEADVFVTGEQEPQPSVSFDAEEDLDIPDFLKS